MSRRSITSIVIAAARQAERERRHAEQEQRRRELDQIRRQRELERREKALSKWQKQQYLEHRQQEAANQSKAVNEKFDYLTNLVLKEAKPFDSCVVFSSLSPAYNPPVLTFPEALQKPPPLAPSLDRYIDTVGPMPFWGKFFNGIRAKWERKRELAQSEFRAALEKWEASIQSAEDQCTSIRNGYEQAKVEYDMQHAQDVAELETSRTNYLNRDRDAICEYLELILEKSEYRVEWSREVEVAYNPDNKEVLVNFALPAADIVPSDLEYRHIKNRDMIEPKARKRSDVEYAYKTTICSLAIRTIYEIFNADISSEDLGFTLVVFNGFVRTIDPSTGNQVSPTLISLAVTSDEFSAISIENIDSISCIRKLSASFSPSPIELLPVKPVKEYSMVDSRFVAEQDIASTLDDRSNLMDLDPFQFENLVSNLFSKMGLETKQTRASRDGGVDAVAFDPRPVLGGKVVIQAKRYKNTVGVSAVRDLYGTMINEGASKGILVCTSSYGPDAYEFGKTKPIELIDGNGLLYLLEKVGIQARIVMPME